MIARVVVLFSTAVVEANSVVFPVVFVVVVVVDVVTIVCSYLNYHLKCDQASIQQ